MSLYPHLASKDDIADGMVDLVVSEIHAPSQGANWKIAMRQRAISCPPGLRAPPLGSHADRAAPLPRYGS